ncbi:MAG: hypothetical protein V4692_09245 [Bdellovibrionota bacterium]
MSLQRRLVKVLGFLSAALLVNAATSPAEAYFSVLDTGDVIPPGSYQALLAPQVILTNYDGFNAVGMFDVGLTEETSARALLGFGKVDYQIGGMYKWIPFPDVGNQPAIGGQAGVILARVNGDTQFSLRFNPLVSKRLETEIGDITPFVSLPIGFTTYRNETYVPVQLVGGSEFTPIDMKNISFLAELGINVSRAFGYISGAVAWRFDELETR